MRSEAVLLVGPFNTVDAETVRRLKWASTLGPVVVAVFNDNHVDSVTPLLDRVEVLRACRHVHDVVVVIDEQEALRRVRPTVLAVGARDTVDEQLCDELYVQVARHMQSRPRPQTPVHGAFTAY